MEQANGVLLQIVSNRVGDEEFRKQVDLVRSTGAAYDEMEQVWRLRLTAEQLTADVLDPLFEAARTYGTHVSVVYDDH